MSNKKLKIVAGSTVAAVAVLALGAFALFTDNDNGSISSTAGTVKVSLGDVSLENAGNINPGDNDEDTPETYIPDPDDPLYDVDENGEPIPVPVKTTPHDLVFSVANDGTKSIRTRQTLILQCIQEKGDEFVVLDPTYLSLLFDKNEEIGYAAGKGIKLYVLADGSEVSSYTEEDTVVAIKYQLTPDIFDGVGSAAEKEEVSTVHEDDNGVCSQEYTYKLKMESDTPNEYQGATINIDIVVEAMQYRNTGASDWQLMTTKTVSGQLTGISQDTVPNKAE